MATGPGLADAKTDKEQVTSQQYAEISEDAIQEEAASCRLSETEPDK